jgi:hypothetical protein
MVYHPESIKLSYRPMPAQWAEETDRDGHHIAYKMHTVPHRTCTTLELSLPRGMTASSASDLLRKIAVLLERNPHLLATRKGDEGHFLPDGTAAKSPLALDDFYERLDQMELPKNQ